MTLDLNNNKNNQISYEDILLINSLLSAYKRNETSG